MKIYKRSKQSDCSCGYDWMVSSILINGEIEG